MAERRRLVEGLKPSVTLDPETERQFIRQHAPATSLEPAPAIRSETPSSAARAPISTRIRADIADALKRASLQRKLDNIEPNAMSEILEITLEPWLKSNGYLS